MSFVNPHLLWGLLLLAAPIIIHLLNKRRFQVEDWAAMDFLLKADMSNRRRVRFEDLLLLLLRTLLIAVVVLLVARPVVEGWGARDEGTRIIIVDDSFSMEYRTGGQSNLERARERAAFEVEEAIAMGVRVGVYRGTRPEEEIGKVEGRVRGGEVVTADTTGSDGTASSTAVSFTAVSFTEDAVRLLASLRALDARDGILQLPAAIRGVAEKIVDDPGGEPISLVLVSDFRRSDWFLDSGELKPRLEEAFRELVRVGRERVRLRFIPVGNSSRENCAALKVASDTRQPVAGTPVVLSVEVKNFGSEGRSGLTGKLEVGDPDHPSHRIPLPTFTPIPPGGSATVEVRHVFDRPGEYPLSVQLDEDLLARDDQAFTVLVVRDALSVLVVDGDPGTGRFEGEAGFLSAALSPRGKMSSGIRPEVFPMPITDTLLEGRDVALLLNCPEFTNQEHDALKRFVGDGGGIAFFLGNRVRPGRYEEELGGTGIFPALLGGRISAEEGVRIDFGDFQHSALEVYRGLRDASVERITAARYFQLEPGEGAQVVASYRDALGTAAIVERSHGLGRTSLFNISADRDWTDWPTDPSFPVILQEWIRYLAPRRSEARQVRVGDALVWPAEGSPELLVRDPESRTHPVDLAVATARFERTDLAGIYHVEVAPGQAPEENRTGRQKWFAVNRQHEESDLTPATVGELRGVLSSTGLSFGFNNFEEQGVGEDNGGDLSRWFALSAGVLLLGELLAAYWIGRRG